MYFYKEYSRTPIQLEKDGGFRLEMYLFVPIYYLMLTRFFIMTFVTTISAMAMIISKIVFVTGI